MSFEEKEHTADILMHIRAPDLEQLLCDAGHALMKIMYRGIASPKQEVSISISGKTPENLLHEFLSELLYESEVSNLVFSEFQIKIAEDHVYALAKGEPFCQKIHGGGTEVKGISWYGLSIVRENDEYSCDVLFDV